MPSDAGVPPRAGELRFVDSNPHVAFFARDPDRGLVQPANACLDWGVIGSRWWSLDAWGQVVGEFELRGGDGYPVTNCYELDFQAIAGELGTGLLVTGPYRAPEPARWQPDANQLARLEARVASLDAVFAAADPARPLAERTLAYRRGGMWTDDGGSASWIAVGGRWLGLFSWESSGDWQLRYLDASLATDEFLPPDAQQPLAAFDLDGDADPELIVHQDQGPSWNDVLLRPDWSRAELVFESPGGATI